MHGSYQTQTAESPPLSLLVLVIAPCYLAVVSYLAEMGQKIPEMGSEARYLLPP